MFSFNSEIKILNKLLDKIGQQSVNIASILDAKELFNASAP